LIQRNVALLPHSDLGSGSISQCEICHVFNRVEFSIHSAQTASAYPVPSSQHNVVPEPEMVSEITHVIIAFMQSSHFNQKEVSTWPLFTTVEEVRSKFAEGTKIMVAIGGWGDTAGFSRGARTVNTRRLFAKNVKAMVDATGADGMSTTFAHKETFLTLNQGLT
jgi:hypothetical protein